MGDGGLRGGIRRRAVELRRDLNARRVEELSGIACGRICPACRQSVDKPGFTRGWVACIHDFHSQADIGAIVRTTLSV